MHENYKTVTRVLKAIGSQSGARIFALLGGVKEMCVSDIAGRTGLSVSATSHQLQRMESAGLVESWRDSRTICYSIKKDPITIGLLKCVKDLLKAHK